MQADRLARLLFELSKAAGFLVEQHIDPPLPDEQYEMTLRLEYEGGVAIETVREEIVLPEEVPPVRISGWMWAGFGIGLLLWLVGLQRIYVIRSKRRRAVQPSLT